MRTILVYLLLILPLFAGDPWTKADISRQAVATSLLVVDWGQTLDIERNPSFHETNIFLGKHPSRGSINAYFAGCIVGSYFVADALPSKWRGRFQTALIIVQIGASGNNHRIGLRIRF